MSNPQPPAASAAPITAEEIALLRRLLALHQDDPRFGERLRFEAQHTLPKLLAATAAEAKAVEFAWATVKAYGNAVAFDKGLIFLPHYSDRKAFEAAEYLESKGLLRRTDKCEWQRVEGGK